MKNLFFAVALILGFNISAQEQREPTTAFLRVFDLQGKKISKGRILVISDSSLQLKGKKEIEASHIGMIKTKHSGGNNVLIGAVAGASLFAVLGAASSDPENMFLPYTAGEGAAAGVILGAPLGAGVGGLTVLLKNSKTYIINGDEIRFKEFRESILE